MSDRRCTIDGEPPARRPLDTVDINAHRRDGSAVLMHISMGFYPADHPKAGDICELFIGLKKHDSELAKHLQDTAMQTSYALQAGRRIEQLYEGMHKGDDGEPETLLGHALRAVIDHLNEGQRGE